MESKCDGVDDNSDVQSSPKVLSLFVPPTTAAFGVNVWNYVLFNQYEACTTALL